MTAAAAGPRIALLSPYWGGNLGDGAILRATVENLTALEPRVEFVGVTLQPRGMRQQHGIDGTSLVSFRRHYYSDSAPQPNGDSGDAEADQGSPKRRIKYLMARHFPAIYGAARQLRAVLTAVVSELFHFVHAWRFLRATEALVIAGGGQLDEEWGGPWGHPYALLKWTWAAKLARRPVLFLSVGVGRLNTPLAQRFTAAALRRADYVSLRDPWSKSFVETRVLWRNYELMPDLAFSLPVAQPHRPVDQGGKLTIGVSPIAYGKRHVWPTIAQEASESYLRVLADFVEHQLAAGHTVVLFHTDVPDRDVVAGLVESVRQRIADDALPRLQVAATDALAPLLELLPRLDLVVASRLHGLILSHLHGIPSLAISYDRKVTTHMEQVGHSEYCLEFEEVQLAALLERFDSLADRQAALRQELATLGERWRSQLIAQYRQVLGRIAGDAAADRARLDGQREW